MTKLGKVVALVPLRGGSKSIPKKNIKPIAGKPLCSWSLDALLGCAGIDEVYVSTDSDEIKSVVKEHNPQVKVIDRPAEYATDEASTESVLLHFAENVSFDVLVTAQATSPLVTSEDLETALNKMQADSLDSMVTCVRTWRFYWSPDGKPLNYDPVNRPRRQDFDGTFIENGAFYLTKRAVLEQYKCRLGGAMGVHEMGPETELEIDEPDDWTQVEQLLRSHQSEPGTTIKAIVCDVDGTLTDGGMYYDASGEALKKFNTRDAVGLRRLAENGIDVWVITGEKSPAVVSRLKKLNITESHFGIADKVPVLKSLCESKNIKLSEVAYIGDDLNDVDCLGIVGLPACPSDAAAEVKQISKFVCGKNGGQGAVREFCEHLLKTKVNA